MATTPYDDRSRMEADKEAPHLTSVSAADDTRSVLINRVSWGAVFAGAALMLTAQIVLNLIGIGIGASTLDPLTSDNPSASSFSIGAAIWWAVSGIIAAFLGGYVASRLSGTPKDSTGSWHGLTAWAVGTLVLFYLLTTTIGSLVGGAFSGVSSAVGGLGRGAATAAQVAAPSLTNATDPFSALDRMVKNTSGNDPAALQDAAVAAMRAVVTGDQAQADAAREQAAQALAKAQNIPVDQAKTKVGEYEKQYMDTVASAKEKAKQAADVTAKAVTTGALLGSVALLLGALAAWFGGKAGSITPTVTAGTRRNTA